MWDMVLGLLMIYIIVGLVWTLFFTGILVYKATKDRLWDVTTATVIVACFFISLIGWPWSVKNNLSYFI